MKKLVAVVSVLVLLSICALSAFADAEWMDTMTSSGNKYEGYVENGNLNGFGILTWENTGQHYGMFANGSRNGFGIYIYPDGEEETAYLILGSFIDGKLNGRGIVQYKDGRRYDGPFEEGVRTAEIGFTKNEYGFVRDVYLGEGNDYTGEVLPDTTTPNGFGIMIAGNGDLYVGQFVSGVREGYGIACSYEEKAVTSGIWANDELVEPGAEWN